ncbi:hypothetical protein EP56_07815 [Listeriaceae bacterium FSL A5-0209]|nr:hypothetical protein EP56_07815 [Listeriaceae bacterium FSL A5-0209]
MKYRKKPVEVEAFQFDPDKNAREPDWFWLGIGTGVIAAQYQGSVQSWHIETLEGLMQISKGDWIIRGVKGELYPCKPDIFEMTYEAVKE